MDNSDLYEENSGRLTRPSLDQVKAVVEYLERSPHLSFKKIRFGLDAESYRKLWIDVSKIANSIDGTLKSTKGWIKFFADKRRHIIEKRRSIQIGKCNEVISPLEKRILELCGDKSVTKRKKKKPLAVDTCNGDVSSSDEHSGKINELDCISKTDNDSIVSDGRQWDVMEKMVEVMEHQAKAMALIAQSSLDSSTAFERLADASNVQAIAVDRLSTTFESIGSSMQDIRNSFVSIDYTMKKCYNNAQERQNSSLFS